MIWYCYVLKPLSVVLNLSDSCNDFKSFEVFVKMLIVHGDQNNSYEITINGYQIRKINEIRNVIFGLHYGKPSSALGRKLECSPSWVLDDIQRFLGEPCLNKHRFVIYVNSIEKSESNLQIPFFLSSDRRSDNVAPVFPKFSDLFRAYIGNYFLLLSLLPKLFGNYGWLRWGIVRLLYRHATNFKSFQILRNLFSLS